MSSLGTMINISSGTRKLLPVDVQDDDGLFTRGYVRDVFDDGKVLVFYGGGRDPSKTVEPDRLFQPRNLIKSEGFTHDYGIFNTDTKVEVLVRLEPGSTARWYPGIVSDKNTNKSLVDIEVGGGVTRKGFFGDVFHSTDIQLPTPRARARFIGLTLPIRYELDVSEMDDDFCVAWEGLTRSIIKAVDPEKKLLVVLMQEGVEGEYGPPSSRRLEELLFELRGFGFLQHGNAQVADSVRDGGWVEEDGRSVSPGPSQEASTALMIPEILVGVFRCLGLENRHTLRGVCRTWRDFMDNVQVCRSACFDDNWEMEQPSENRFVKDMERCRYLSRLHFDYLTSITLHCGNNWGEFCKCTSFVETLAFVGPALVPQLKTLCLYDGFVCSTKLIWGILQLESTPRILLKNVHLDCPVIAGVALANAHVYIKSDVLDLTSTVVDETTVPDDITGLLEMEDHVDDKVKKALIAMRKLLVPLLDATPLGCTEDYILTEIARIPLESEWHRKRVQQAIKVLDPGCFKPEMDGYGTSIHLAKSLLQNSTLHVCKTIIADHYEATYSCGDTSCCKKRKRSCS